MVARRAHNPKVVGSNPASATMVPCVAVNMSACHAEDREFDSRRPPCGFCSSVVEQRTENPRVGGSIPPGATILFYYEDESAPVSIG